MLDDKSNWPYYSASLVKIQRDFVKERPASVKDLIRLVKFWRKTFVPQIGSKRLPPSYLLELLTILAWERANRPESFDMKIGFKAVMEVLKNHQSLRVFWEHYYRRNLIPSGYVHGEFKTVLLQCRNKRAAFYVLDEMGSDVDKPAQKFRETSLYPLLPLTHWVLFSHNPFTFFQSVEKSASNGSRGKTFVTRC